MDPQIPIPISYIGSKYLIFDIEAVTWLRKVHHICGVMTGTLPQAPSQNIFLGLPVQIMPEEAQLLVERKVAYIVDDAQAHDQALHSLNTAEKSSYMTQVRSRGEKVTIARNEEKKEAARQKMNQSKMKAKTKPREQQNLSSASSSTIASDLDISLSTTAEDQTDSLFESTSTIRSRTPPISTQVVPHGIIPTTSNLWLPTPPSTPSASTSMVLLPNVPPSYALYRHLNSKSYYMTPGLRFGCQYNVYPGDPLRFHSHFLAVGVQWTEEIDLMNIIGGGRLGTGVKKGFLIGGEEPASSAQDPSKQNDARVRTFSIEWAVM